MARARARCAGMLIKPCRSRDPLRTNARANVRGRNDGRKKKRAAPIARASPDLQPPTAKILTSPASSRDLSVHHGRMTRLPERGLWRELTRPRGSRVKVMGCSVPASLGRALPSERNRDIPVWRRQCAKLAERNRDAAAERVPARLRGRTESGERRPGVSGIERRVGLHHAKQRAHRLAKAASFSRQVVLDCAADPDAWHVLVDHQAEMMFLAHSRSTNRMSATQASCADSSTCSLLGA
jgi:hypothetical protein